MPRLTVTITDDQAELLEELSGEGGEYESKSAAVRDFIQAGEDRQKLETEIVRLEERLESREDRIDELERQLSKRSEIEEKVDVLANRVEEGEQPDPPFVVRWWQWWRQRD
jgi:Arc/MetJ-type ribon-helix-helix transcriptional regulator